MFTGIVDHCGKLLKQQALSGSLTLVIETKWDDLALGESISVDGTCLTVNRLENPGTFECNLSAETLKLTRAGTLKPGMALNVERSLKPQDRIGGHWVTGHVDQRAVVTEKEVMADFHRLIIGDIWPEHRKHLLKKGCVTVNGVSLTINEVSEKGFEVCLIPHTLERTNLRELEAGSLVNLEFDWMCKMVLTRLEELMSLQQKETTPWRN